MMYGAHLAIGDICRDPTGLLVRVEDIDIYDYVYFSVIESSEPEDDEVELGEMSHVAFAHRFTKLGNMLLNRNSRLTGVDGEAAALYCDEHRGAR